MEVKSLKALTEVVERTENVGDRIRALRSKDNDVDIPEVPLPLSLNAIEAWLELATECNRKPLLARSKQLLGAKGIATATISAAVLEEPDSIADLLQRVDRLHGDLQAGAFESIARALTKSIEDGESVVASFTAASNDLSTLRDPEGWVVALAAAKIVDSPSTARAVVEMARRVIEHRDATTRRGVEVSPSPSLEEALANLTRFNVLNQEHDRLLASEGLSEERVLLAGLSVQEAENKLLLATTKVNNEKADLIQEARSIQSHLELIGGESSNDASTVAELRKAIPLLRESLDERRRVLQRSLGVSAFHIVESLSEGRLPASEEATDEELGNAIRKAVDCGYRFRLEAPREN